MPIRRIRMNQERIMKRRMVSAIIVAIVTLVALLVFIGLYIDETKRVQETYKLQYKVNLAHVSEDLESYINGEGDYEMKYTRLVSDMSSVNSFAFLIDDFTEQQKAINQINSCLIKYPVQMKTKLEELKTIVDDISQDLDKGYENAFKLVESINKLGE